jgi:hypothetical protein
VKATKKDLSELERAVIKAALARYREWTNLHGELLPWGHQQGFASKPSWNLVHAVERLYKAKRAA